MFCVSMHSVVVIALPVHAQPLADDQCSMPAVAGRFVLTSRDQVNKGADRDSVLGTLSCIARSGMNEWPVAKSAVRALFALAQNDSTRRELLLEIIVDPKSGTNVSRLACELLTYVADEATRAAMLEQLKKTWPATAGWAGYFAFFIDLGDRDFLKWLESALEAFEDPHRQALEADARRIRIQQDPEDLIAYLQAEGNDLYRAWAARQALRHGVPKERVGNAVVAIIQRGADEPKGQTRHLLLVKECEELGIFRPEYEAVLGPIRERLNRVSDSCELGPPWAEATIAAKRAEFYGLNRKTNEGK